MAPVMPDPRVQAWVSAQLGPTGPWVRLDAMRGSTNVFWLTTTNGDDRVVKHFRSARGFEQERRALTEWFNPGAEESGAPRRAKWFNPGAEESGAPRRAKWFSGRVGGARVPRLVAAAPELAVMIVERLPGAEPQEHAADAAIVHRAAGQFLAGLHQLEPVDADPVPLAEALLRRTRAWLGRAPLEPEQLRIVEEHGPRAELFATVRRVACHRDFAPRNWLWDGETLAIVDFEHARPDLALADLAKLCVGSWARRPDLAAAFFDGYGRVPTDLERKQLRALVVLHGVASLAWGHARGDVDLLAEGRCALAMAAVGELGF
jgi:hypothetical protein